MKRHPNSKDTLSTTGRHSLRWLAFRLGVRLPMLVSLSESCSSHYQPFPVVKGEKVRLIDNPDRELKYVQRRIRSRILTLQPLPTFVHGCVKNRSPLTNARTHCKQVSLASIDIRDFYPNVSYNMVYKLWGRLGLGPKLAGILTKLTTTRGCLPQGAPTSDAIANLVLRPIDDEIGAIAERLGLSCSRYLDNIDLAGARSRECIPLVIAALRRGGFSVRHKKTFNAGPRSAHVVTGYNVNGDEPSVPRSYRTRVRAKVHRLVVATQCGEDTEHMAQSVKGALVHLRNSNPGDVARLERQLEKAGVSLGPTKNRRRSRQQRRQSDIQGQAGSAPGEGNPAATRSAVAAGTEGALTPPTITA